MLDVKTGSGAFMKTLDDSIRLAEAMVQIGESVNRRTVALITNMDIPLGNAIGNSNEIIEAVKTLKGEGPTDLTDVCVRLAAEMLYLVGKDSKGSCLEMALQQIKNGKALNKLVEMVSAQGGDSSYITDTDKFEKAGIVYEAKAADSGYISEMNAEICGAASCMLGAGRETEQSVIDYSAGIIIKAKTGDTVKKGDTIAKLYTSDLKLAKNAAHKFLEGIKFSDEMPKKMPLIYSKVSKDGVNKCEVNGL